MRSGSATSGVGARLVSVHRDSTKSRYASPRQGVAEWYNCTAISQLPEREGSVFCMRYFDDLSNRDIADTLQVRPGAVAVALHKARAKLETLLNLAPAATRGAVRPGSGWPSPTPSC